MFLLLPSNLLQNFIYYNTVKPVKTDTIHISNSHVYDTVSNSHSIHKIQMHQFYIATTSIRYSLFFSFKYFLSTEERNIQHCSLT